MGQFQAKSTPEQREALARAVLDAGLSVEKALDEARFGNLPHPRRPGQTVGTFELGRARAYDIVNAARADREAAEIHGTPHLAHRLDEMARRVTVLAEKELRKLELEERQGKPMHTGRLKSVATVIRTLTLAKPPPYKPKTPEPENGKTEPEQTDLLTRLAQTETSNATLDASPVQTETTQSEDDQETSTDSRFVSARGVGDHTSPRLRRPV